MGEGQDDVCGCVLGFPTCHTVVPVSGSSRDSGYLPKHAAAVGWHNPYPLGRKMWNHGQSSSRTDRAAGNGAGPGSEGNIHWSEMGIY